MLFDSLTLPALIFPRRLTETYYCQWLMAIAAMQASTQTLLDHPGPRHTYSGQHSMQPCTAVCYYSPAVLLLLWSCCPADVVLLSNAHPYSSCSHASLGLSILQLVAAGVRGVAPSDPMPCIDTFAMHWVPHTHTATASHSTCAAAWLGASHLVWEPFPRHLSIKKKVTIHQVS